MLRHVRLGKVRLGSSRSKQIGVVVIVVGELS